MINTVKMNVEEQSGPLAESEVARLLGVLQNAEFKRSETRNVTKDHSFKPRSLMEIAIEAQQREAEIEVAKQAEETLAAAKRAGASSNNTLQAGKDLNLDNLNLADTNSDKLESAISNDDDDFLKPTDAAEDVRGQTEATDSQPSPIIDTTENVMPDTASDTGSDDQSQNLSDGSVNPALINDGHVNHGVSDDGLVKNTNEDELEVVSDESEAGRGAQIAADFETVTAAFERGKAEGMVAGREAGVAETKAAAEAAAQANLANKITSFEAALSALTKPQALQAEDLSRSINATILKLASQRAGQQIEDMPKNFLAHIEALVASIGQKMTAGSVHINAEDYKVMLPYLADADFDFVAEPSLARGDIILKFGGVELHDIAEDRLGGQYTETLKNMAEVPSETGDFVAKPTMAEPTISEPITAEPTTAEPSTAEPTTAEPTTVEPTTAELTKADSAPQIRMMTTSQPSVKNDDASDNAASKEPVPLVSTTAEPTTAELTKADSAPQIRMMTTSHPSVTDDDASDNAASEELAPLESTAAEPMTAELAKADSAPQIRMMTTSHPLVTDDDASDNAASDQVQKDEPNVPSGEASS